MSDKVAEIPQEIRDKIAEYIKASLPAWDNPRQIDAEFGYSLAQQEIAELKDAIKCRNIIQEEDQQEIERLKGLIEKQYRARMRFPKRQMLDESWNEFKTENNL